jgi:nitroreductase
MPTANYAQPWEFVVVTARGVLRGIAKITDYGSFIAETPVYVLVLCRDTKHYVSAAHRISCWTPARSALARVGSPGIRSLT